MRHAELAWLSAEVELRRQDLASGMVPHDVTRPLFEHERFTDYSALEAGVDRIAGGLAKLLEQDRAAFIDLLAADLAAVAANPGADPVDVAVANRLMALDATLGIGSIAGAQQLVDQAEQKYRSILAAAATAGGARVIGEATRQGVTVPDGTQPKLEGLDEYRLDLAARRLALAPHTDLLDAAAALAYQLPGIRPGQLETDVIGQLRTLSPQPLLTTLARPAVQQADGIGRTATMVQLPTATRYYASELLDKATCGPCSQIDGTEYDTLDQAKADYPNGGYKDCAGGDRCRGSIVAVWSTETPPGG